MNYRNYRNQRNHRKRRNQQFHRQTHAAREETFTLNLGTHAGAALELTYTIEAFVTVTEAGPGGWISLRPTAIRLSGQEEKLDL